MMKNKQNLRFLLALGDRKVVVLQDEQELSVYSDTPTTRGAGRVSVERITSAVTAR